MSYRTNKDIIIIIIIIIIAIVKGLVYPCPIPNWFVYPHPIPSLLIPGGLIYTYKRHLVSVDGYDTVTPRASLRIFRHFYTTVRDARPLHLNHNKHNGMF